MDSLDHIQNRILWIHDPKGFFTTDAPDGCEYSQPYSRNNFDTYSSCLTTLLIFKAIFEVGAWIKRLILSVVSWPASKLSICGIS